MINVLLGELNDMDSGIKGSAVTSKDGLLLNHLVQEKLNNEDHVSAISAALFGVSKKINAHLFDGEGGLEYVIVKGELGKVLVMPLNDEVFLVTLTQIDVDANTILQQMLVFKEKYIANPALVLY